jgi:TPR repeat protein
MQRVTFRRIAINALAAIVLLNGSLAYADDALPAGTSELRLAAERGDPVAQFCLGNRYYTKRHKEPDAVAEAEKWFRLAAAQGNPQAEVRLGQIYYIGRGESQDYSQAATWFQKAAEHGNREAQQRLAQMYWEGRGVAADREKAKMWNELAARSAAPTPCYPRTEQVADSSSGGMGEALPDYPDLRRAAEKGDANAQFQLGERYYDERVRDPAKDAEVQKWLGLAAAQENAQAEDRLGWINYRGNGVPQDYAQAAIWYRRAAEHGNLDAMTRLGNMYREGKGVPRDLKEAHHWINKASEIGTRPARMREYRWLAGCMLVLAAFAGSLMLLWQDKVRGWRRVVLASFVHLIGVALVLNTLITFGLPELIFPKCSPGGWLSTSCWNYTDPAVRKFATSLHDWQMMNLIWRFMAMVGFVFDALAILYLAFLWRGLLRRRPGREAAAGMGG